MHHWEHDFVILISDMMTTTTAAERAYMPYQLLLAQYHWHMYKHGRKNENCSFAGVLACVYT